MKKVFNGWLPQDKTLLKWDFTCCDNHRVEVNGKQLMVKAKFLGEWFYAEKGDESRWKKWPPKKVKITIEECDTN